MIALVGSTGISILFSSNLSYCSGCIESTSTIPSIILENSEPKTIAIIPPNECPTKIIGLESERKVIA